MDVSHLKRDSGKIHEVMVSGKDDSIKVTKACKIYIPASYTEKQLATIGNEITIVGIFGIVVDDKYYGVSSANTIVQIEPSVTNTVVIEDSTYYEFIFKPGDTFIANTNTVKRDTLVYRVFDEMVSKGNTPWYMGYRDIGILFDTAGYHGGANLNTNHAIMEMITASRARSDKDRTKYYRHGLKTKAQLTDSPPVMIPLSSVQFGATNTTAKLMGAYWDEGVTSALVSPSKRNEQIEDHLRK